MKKYLLIAVIFISQISFSQSVADASTSSVGVNVSKNVNYDSIAKKTLESISFNIHKEVNVIDNAWIKEMINSPLNDSEMYSIEEGEEFQSEMAELPTKLLKKRLAQMDKMTPFNVEYNPQLESIIKSFLQKRKKLFSVVMERGRYFFPMFEEHLAKYNIPLELKYLAIVESALKPTAVSSAGAAGLWQFMYQTGILYNLDVSSYVDERSDPFRATEAACKYLSTLYNIYNDWDMALAAYNSGPGNVNKAIRRAGGETNYWKIRDYLPKETASYVPLFYATMYVFNYASEHNIKAKESAINLFETDTVQVKRRLTFDQIKETLKVDEEVLTFLNPQYKLGVIPYDAKKKYVLTLPVKHIGNFVSNEKLIYAYVDAQKAAMDKPDLPKVEMLAEETHVVRKGEYLGRIASNYSVSVNDIKRWNNLKSSNVQVGQRLKINSGNNSSGIASASSSKSSSSKSDYITYTVRSGDSLWSIANKYANVSVDHIKKWNNIWGNSIKPGTKLKIQNI